MLGVGRHGPLGPTAAIPSPVERGAAPGGSGSAQPSAAIPERHALAVLVGVDGLGPVTLGRLVARLGSATAVLEAADRGDAATLRQAARGEDREAPSGLVPRILEAARSASATIRRLERAAVDILTLDDPRYPPRLRAIELPPHVLFLRGDPAALSQRRAVAVVGTRRPSDSGRQMAARIAAALARTGAAVVSGLAIGIDGAAHAACVEEGGVTVGVLGGGHDRLFPRSHRRLVEAILAGGGAVVSELPPDAEPTPGTFPRRNRVISGLSEATIVVEAGARSGALVTAQWALEQGRDCFVVPGPVDRPTSAGCLSLLREAHGVVRVVAGVPQLLEDLDLVSGGRGSGVAGRAAAAALVELGEVPRRLAGELLAGHATTDELVAVTRLPIATVLAGLTLLEARGLVVDAYGRYRPAGLLLAAPLPAPALPSADRSRRPDRDPGGRD